MATVQEKDTASLQFVEVLTNLGTFKTAISLLQKAGILGFLVLPT